MRVLRGVIISNRMSRTVVVRVDRLRRHPKYRKYYRVGRRYKADVADATSFHIGDIVEIRETRPLSKDKRWIVIQQLKEAAALSTAESAAAAAAEEQGL